MYNKIPSAKRRQTPLKEQCGMTCSTGHQHCIATVINRDANEYTNVRNGAGTIVYPFGKNWLTLCTTHVYTKPIPGEI